MAVYGPQTQSSAVAPLWQPKRPIFEPKLDLGFVGILLYLIIEYTRLPAMFPVLQSFQVAKIAVFIATIGWMLSAKIRPAERRNTASIDVCLLVFLLSASVSVLFALDTTMALDQYADLLRWVVLYLLISRVVASRWRIRIFLLLLLLLNLKLAQFGIRTYHAGVQMGATQQFMARGVGAGSTGWFANSNDFGTAMAVIWPLAGVLVFAERGLWRFIALASFLVISGSILFSGSRGALVGALAAGFVTWARSPKRLAGPVMLLVIVMGGYLFLPQANKDRIASAVHFEQDQNAQTRIALWTAGLQMFAKHPIFGVGIGNYRAGYIDLYGGGIDPRRVLVPHSVYIQALAELGLCGTIPLLVLFGLVLRTNARICRRLFHEAEKRKHSFEYYVALGLNLSMVAFLVSGAFLTVLYYPHFWMLLPLTVGLDIACSQMHPKEFSRGAKPRRGSSLNGRFQEART